MIEELVRQRLFQGDNKKCFTSNNTEANWHALALCAQTYERLIGQFLQKKGCEAEITTELVFLDPVESSSDQY